MPSLKLCDIAAQVRAKRERRKEARPGELLAAALALFVEKGYAATRVEEVAKRGQCLIRDRKSGEKVTPFPVSPPSRSSS